MLFLFICSVLAACSSCASSFDQAKMFEQAKKDCYQGSSGLCDSDIQALRDHGDDADANIAAAYRTAGH